MFASSLFSSLSQTYARVAAALICCNLRGTGPGGGGLRRHVSARCASFPPPDLLVSVSSQLKTSSTLAAGPKYCRRLEGFAICISQLSRMTGPDNGWTVTEISSSNPSRQHQPVPPSHSFRRTSPTACQGWLACVGVCPPAPRRTKKACSVCGAPAINDPGTLPMATSSWRLIVILILILILILAPWAGLNSTGTWHARRVARSPKIIHDEGSVVSSISRTPISIQQPPIPPYLPYLRYLMDNGPQHLR